MLFSPQIRSVGPNGIPKWSTPSLTRHIHPVPPPTNIKVTVINNPVLDTENEIMEVIALVQWELPILDNRRKSDNMQRRRRRQQSNEGGKSQTGSGMGQGESGDGVEVVPVELGELTNVSIYMDTTSLYKFAPRPEENVKEFKV